MEAELRELKEQQSALAEDIQAKEREISTLTQSREDEMANGFKDLEKNVRSRIACPHAAWM
jgi:hypothetical protein